jgi:DNA-binding winged helix-turn-helix (wHTH) protein/TolB-like protein
VVVDTEKRIYEFGPFRLDPTERLLTQNGVAVSLEPKVFQTLVVLVQNSRHLLTKDELMKELWPDAFVEEGSLTRNISTLRRILTERPNGITYIQTIPREGYRFVAEVKEIVAGTPGREDAEGKNVTNQSGRNGNNGTLVDQVSRGVPAGLAPRREPFNSRQWLRAHRLFLVLIALLIIPVSGLIYFKSTEKLRAKPGLSSIRSIAVLPFKSLTTQPHDDRLDLGLADSLITQLSKIRQLSVCPTSTVTKFAGRQQDSITIGRQLSVDAVLESSYQQIGNRLKINSQLVGVSDGKILWSFQCSECVDILTMQESVSTSIAQQLNFELTIEERRLLTKHYTDSREAYQLYLDGRTEWNKRTRDSTETAIRFFEQALERDADYAAAYSGLADCYIALGSILAAAPPRAVMPKAKYTAQRAIELDDSLAEAHASLGFELMWHEWDFAGAKGEFERAIALDPKYATAHQWYANYLTAIGHHEEAIKEARLACELDPTSANKQSNLGHLLYLARQYNQAIEQAGKVHELEPQMATMYVSGAYLASGRYSEGVEYYIETNRAHGADPPKLEELRTAFDTGGIRAYWKTQLKQFLDAPRPEGEPTRYCAILYSLLGEKSKALLYLEKMYQERNGFLIYLSVDPAFDTLRGEPSFDDLLRRVGLAA